MQRHYFTDKNIYSVNIYCFAILFSKFLKPNHWSNTNRITSFAKTHELTGECNATGEVYRLLLDISIKHTAGYCSKKTLILLVKGIPPSPRYKHKSKITE